MITRRQCSPITFAGAVVEAGVLVAGGGRLAGGGGQRDVGALRPAPRYGTDSLWGHEHLTAGGPGGGIKGRKD